MKNHALLPEQGGACIIPGMDTLVYVGTYSVRRSEGVYIYRMEPESGELVRIGAAPAGENPSFLAVDNGQRVLYAVNEVESFDGNPGGAVRAFSIDRSTGALRFLNARSSRAAGPCHLSMDAGGKWVLVANYAGGGVAILPVLPGGRFGEAADFVQHPMPAVKRERQDEPHPHSIVVCPENRYAFCPDLGLDRIMVYRLDLVAGRLHAHTPPWVDVRQGAGPRHLAFHPSGRFAYLINELDNTVCSFAYRDGALDPIQTISSLPAGWSGTSLGADIHLSPDGRFVYGSNRGHDSIVIYAVDAARGTLMLLGHESTRGTWPRNFAVDPAGRYLLVANERSDTVVSFRIDAQSGLLIPTGRTVAVPAPACVKVLAPPGA